MKSQRKSYEPEPSVSLEKKDNKMFAASCLRMFEEETLCDVTLIAGSQKEKIRAHKFILITRSEVFRTMFCGSYAEASGEVEIPDIEAHILKILLRHMYTGEFQKLTDQDVIPLLYAAEKYEVMDFSDMLERFLMKTLCPHTMCAVLNQATMYNKTALLKECLLIASVKCSHILDSQQFLLLTKESLKAIVASNYRIAGEEKILMACIRWAKYQCEQQKMDITPENMRQCLGTILQSIRFTSMTVEIFTTKVSTENILTDGEKVAFFQSFLNKSEEYKKFNFTNAQERQRSKRYRCVNMDETSILVNKSSDNIALMCAEDMVLLNVFVIIPENDSKKYDDIVHLTIQEVESGIVLHTQNRCLRDSKFSPEVGELDIKPTFKLRKNVNYKVSIRYEGMSIRVKQRIGIGSKIGNTGDLMTLQKEGFKNKNGMRFLQYKPFHGMLSSFQSLAFIQA